MPFIESPSEFASRHGASGPAVEIGGWLVWPNGASLENTPFGAMREPPTDPHERARLSVKYWEKVVEVKTAGFRDLQTDLLLAGQTAAAQGFYPPDGAVRGVDRLKALRDEIRAAQAEVEKARQRVEDTTPEAVKRVEAGRTEVRKRADEFAEQVRSIKL
jgi:hypothetical protein